MLNALKVTLLFILISSNVLFANTLSDSTSQNYEITIYVVTSVSPIDFSSPAILMKTTTDCFINAALKKNYYVIGHTLAKINGPSLPAPRYAAMVGAKQTDKVKLVLNKKLGLAALGSTIGGRMETEKSITRGIKFYSKYNKVAFIKFIINEESLNRIVRFLDYYSQKNDLGFAPCDHYNGALWPRFQYEGSGCSSFGLTLLDVANILPPESKDWIIDINIPMDLIGGEFNNNKKIKLSTISKRKSWYTGNGVENIDYVNYKVYEPSIIYEWINAKRNLNDSIYIPAVEDGIPGLIVDKRNVVFEEGDSILKHRNDSGLFVKNYYNEIYRPKNKK